MWPGLAVVRGALEEVVREEHRQLLLQVRILLHLATEGSSVHTGGSRLCSTLLLGGVVD